MISNNSLEVKDLVLDPILIKNNYNIEINTEKALHHLILQDIESFMRKLGNSFSFIGSEHNNNELHLQKFLKKREIEYEKISEMKFVVGKFFV